MASAAPEATTPASAPGPLTPARSTRPDDQLRLRHLREAAAKAIDFSKGDFSKGEQRHDLDVDELIRLALTKLVDIVGEAAKSISPEGRTAMPQVPWLADCPHADP